MAIGIRSLSYHTHSFLPARLTAAPAARRAEDERARAAEGVVGIEARPEQRARAQVEALEVEDLDSSPPSFCPPILRSSFGGIPPKDESHPIRIAACHPRPRCRSHGRAARARGRRRGRAGRRARRPRSRPPKRMRRPSGVTVAVRRPRRRRRPLRPPWRPRRRLEVGGPHVFMSAILGARRR